FDAADELALVVPASCQRTGRCKECVVEIVQGGDSLSPRTAAEDFLSEPYRLACQSVVEQVDRDVEFAVLRRRLRILMPPGGPPLDLDPAIVRRGDDVLRDGERLATDNLPVLGLAIDLGTTTVVVEVIDLESGCSLAVAAFENPQRFGGSDVLSRIAYDARRPGELRAALRHALNHELREMYRSLGLDRRAVREAYVVGNPTMRDLFFGLDVAGLGCQPFRSTTEVAARLGRRRSTSIERLAHEIGLLAHPRSRVIGGPLVACHVGADAAADLVATGFDRLPAHGRQRRRTFTMLVDIGTNTELVLTDGVRFLAASCPAGPALEGGLVRSGMPAAEGAIESVRLCGSQLSYNTIGNVEPVGICGSGLVDVLAVLHASGRLSADGRFSDGMSTIPLAPEHGVALSRLDVSHLAQAKAANAAGHRILLRALGARPEDVDRMYLAGGFANSLDVGNAIAIGLLPPVPADRVVRAGNASIRGAAALLVSRHARRRLESFVRRIEHVELERESDFFDAFVDGCRFEPMMPLPAPGPAA
ncbi:MAG TPA: ASKHA domain-containing protein, partial [Candidatus Limnocylindrales bacterium]